MAGTVTRTGLQLRKKAQRPCLCEDRRKTNLPRFTVMSNGGRCYMGGGGGGDGKWQEMTPIKCACSTWLCTVLRLCVESSVVSSLSQFLPVTPGK